MPVQVYVVIVQVCENILIYASLFRQMTVDTNGRFQTSHANERNMTLLYIIQKLSPLHRCDARKRYADRQ
jgi:hypothetical protein